MRIQEIQELFIVHIKLLWKYKFTLMNCIFKIKKILPAKIFSEFLDSSTKLLSEHVLEKKVQDFDTKGTCFILKICLTYYNNCFNQRYLRSSCNWWASIREARYPLIHRITVWYRFVGTCQDRVTPWRRDGQRRRATTFQSVNCTHDEMSSA